MKSFISSSSGKLFTKFNKTFIQNSCLVHSRNYHQPISTFYLKNKKVSSDSNKHHKKQSNVSISFNKIKTSENNQENKKLFQPKDIRTKNNEGEEYMTEKEQFIKKYKKDKILIDSEFLNEKNDKIPFTFVERQTISILYNYQQSCLQYKNLPLDKFIHFYLKKNSIGKNSKVEIIKSVYEIKKLNLLLDFVKEFILNIETNKKDYKDLIKNREFKTIVENLKNSFEIYLNRINNLKMTLEDKKQLPNSVTFLEENKQTILNYRIYYYFYKLYFLNNSNILNAIEKMENYLNIKIPKHIKLNCPINLYDLLIENYGQEKADELCLINLQEAPIYGRLNDIKLLNKDKTYSKSDINNVFKKKLPNIFEISKLSDVTTFGIKFNQKQELRLFPEFENGLFEIQDESSQIIIEELIKNIVLKRLTTSKPLVLDFCSGTGGKTFAFIGELKEKGQVYLYDIRLNSIKTELKKRAKRLGVSNISLIYDLEKSNNLHHKMDAVICDVPCSGSGTLRRNVELKYKINFQYVNELVLKQREIIREGMQFCKHYFVYSTCSILKKENEDQVQWILNQYKDLELLKEVKILPTNNGSDGMYGALFFKKHSVASLNNKQE
ncbi:hypothetical protein ABK040_015118 [Willaertia magna]